MIVSVVGGSSESSLRHVPASEILAKIQNGKPVEYDHVIVQGDLDPSQLGMPTKIVVRKPYEIPPSASPGANEISIYLTSVASLISIRNSSFDGFVDFNHVIFEKQIDFSGSNFTKGAHFLYSQFNGYANF